MDPQVSLLLFFECITSILIIVSTSRPVPLTLIVYGGLGQKLCFKASIILKRIDAENVDCICMCVCI